MSAKKLVFVAGSPSESSRSSRVASEVEQSVRRRGGVETVTFTLRDFEPTHVWSADTDAHDVRRFIAQVTEADGIVLSTPVYKATYTGALKSIVDLIPPDALKGKVALPIGTGRLAEHLRSVAAAYSELFTFFRVGHVVPGIFLSDDVIFGDAEKRTVSPVALEQVERVADDILRVLDHRSTATDSRVAGG